MVARKPSAAKRQRCTRFRVGRVSVYLHHGCWWIYYRQQGRAARQRVGSEREHAERVAAELNAQLTSAAPTMFDFRPISVSALRQAFLNYHEQVLRSSLATIQRYRNATGHLVNYVSQLPRHVPAHEVSPVEFVGYLRSCLISPNGHERSKKRPFRDKGVQFIVETCRSMYSYAQRQRHLPPYQPNPFSEMAPDRMRLEDAKPIFLFDASTELQFLEAARNREFPIHFTLAKTGMRSGELCHLLIEDLNLNAGWLHVRNKPELGWSVKTRNERVVPLHPVVRDVLHVVIGNRAAGVVFLRPKLDQTHANYALDRASLGKRLVSELTAFEANTDSVVTRLQRRQLCQKLWHDAGAFDPDQIRRSFLRIATCCGFLQATCPKSWRHSFATLLQDANIDPLLRQITLGHQPKGSNGALGMTSIYTHSRAETHKREIVRAISLQPESLEQAQEWLTRQSPPDFDDDRDRETDSELFPSK
jgi:integrase